MRKNIFFIVFIILCAVSCTEKKSNFINTVHLKGQLFDMGSQNVRMRFDGAASMLGDSRDILLKTDAARSEERRVGKECRSRWSPYH